MEMAVAAMASGRPPSLGGSLSTRLDKLEAAGGDHDGDSHDYRARRLRYDGAGDKSLAQGRDGAHRHL